MRRRVLILQANFLMQFQYDRWEAVHCLLFAKILILLKFIAS
jgi:hypothetical protein